MLLHELEPGTAFKLTAESIETQKKLFEGNPSHYPDPAAVYKIYQPAVAGGDPPGLLGVQGTNRFYPQYGRQYTVEVVPSKVLDATHLPSRGILTTSADPEVFFVDGKGKIVPGFAVLPAKKTPHMLPGIGVFHEDGFQAEFSPTARMCHEEVVARSGDVLSGMYVHAAQKFGNYYSHGLRISDLNFVELDEETLKLGTDAQVALGCEPSENVWGGAWFTHDEPRKFPYRMAGGHIHLGTPSSAKWLHERAERIIKAMDVFCGVPSVALFAGLDDIRRRQYYGKAGEFRFQKHGLEYRVLSNAWLQHPALSHLVLNLARGSFRLGMMNWEPEFSYDPGLVRHIINDYDVEAAKKFIEENAKLLIWLLNSDSAYHWGAKGLTTIYQGAQKVFKGHLGIHKNFISEGPVTVNNRFELFVRSRRIADFGTEPKAPPPPPAPAPSIPQWAVDGPTDDPTWPIPPPTQRTVRAQQTLTSDAVQQAANNLIQRARARQAAQPAVRVARGAARAQQTEDVEIG